MNRYQRGKIYKIVSDLTNGVYIGSTTEPTLAKRLAKHVINYKCYLNGKFHFITSFKILETQNYSIVLLENFPCNSKDELHAKERYYIETTANCVNKVIPKRSNKEYRETNKETIAEQRKGYRDANKEKLAEASKMYRENNKETIAMRKKNYYEANKQTIAEACKMYREANKETIAEKQKEYREKNKEKIADKNGKQYKCDCGGSFTEIHRARHLRTKKHQDYVDQVIESL